LQPGGLSQHFKSVGDIFHHKINTFKSAEGHSLSNSLLARNCGNGIMTN